jgi:hypothetical protein
VRDMRVKWPKSKEELDAFLDELTSEQHDYNTSALAMAEAALAAFNYIGSTLGCTGFQASCADLAFISKTRHMDGPFALLDGSQLLYPQYDLAARVAEYLKEWPPQLAEKARELIAKDDLHAGLKAHPDVRARWEELAGLEPPA